MDRKQNKWANADNYGKKKMAGELTVRDVVDNVLRVPAFGFQGYNPKATVKDMLPIEAHKQQKSKRKMFAEQASDINSFVPGSPKYQTEIDWSK